MNNRPPPSAHPRAHPLAPHRPHRPHRPKRKRKRANGRRSGGPFFFSAALHSATHLHPGLSKDTPASLGGSGRLDSDWTATGQRACMWCRAARCTFSPTGHFHFPRWARPRLIGCARAVSGSLGQPRAGALALTLARACRTLCVPLFPPACAVHRCTGRPQETATWEKNSNTIAEGWSVLSGSAWAAAACRSGPPQCVGARCGCCAVASNGGTGGVGWWAVLRMFHCVVHCRRERARAGMTSGCVGCLRCTGLSRGCRRPPGVCVGAQRLPTGSPYCAAPSDTGIPGDEGRTDGRVQCGVLRRSPGLQLLSRSQLFFLSFFFSLLLSFFHSLSFFFYFLAAAAV